MTVKIEDRIGVRASQERIWEVLADFEGWKDWNPLNPKVDGKLSIGGPLTLEQRWPGRPVDTVHARVIDWIPLEQIHWRTSMARGWVTTVRYLEIEPLGPENCIFSVGELFGGMLGGYVAKRMRPSIRAGFAAVCEALRIEAEKPVAGASAAKTKKAPAKAKTAAAKTAAPAKPPAKKVVVKPLPLKSYAPEPLGMKKPGATKL